MSYNPLSGTVAGSPINVAPSLLRRRVSAGGGGSWWCLLVRGAPLASYGLVAHFPSCSPVVVVVVAHVFEQRPARESVFAFGRR